MRVSRVRLGNWRNFRKVDVALQDRAFLVGPNASGKSNFLDALRFLRDVAAPEGGLQRAVADRGGISHLRCLAARSHPDVTVEVELGDGGRAAWSYRLTVGADKQHQPLVKRETVLREGAQVWSRPDDADRGDPQLLQQTHLEQLSANVKFREIAEFLASIRYYHIVPQLVRKPERYVGPRGDPYGGDFLAQVAEASATTQKYRLRRIREALSVAVPQFTDLKLARDARGVPHLEGTYEHWRLHGKRQDETDFSDGTLRLLGLLWCLLDAKGPLLLEEPELSLHAEVVRQIPGLMARVQRQSGSQAVVSTHSGDLLLDEGIGADEVLLLEPSEEGTTVRTGASIPEVLTLLESGFSLADIVIPRTAPRKAYQLGLFGGEAQ